MADPLVTTLLVRDEGGATQNIATVTQGGNEFPAHLDYGWDGSSTMHPLLIDSSGRQLIAGAAAAGAAAAGNPVQVGGTDGTNARALLTDTTGRLLTPFSRYMTVRGHFTPLASSSYATSLTCIGGVLTVATGLSSGAQVLVDTIDAIMQGTITTATNVIAEIFSSSPTGTWTDGSVVSWSAADAEQRVDSLALTLALQSNAALGSLSAANRSRLATVDSSGNLYLTFITSTSSPSWTTGAILAWAVQLRY